MKHITKHIDKKHKLAHHPINVATIPHIVTVVTIAYMFSIFILAMGFAVGFSNGVLQEREDSINAPVIEEIDTFPVYPEEEFEEYVEEMEMYFRDLEETSVRLQDVNYVLGESEQVEDAILYNSSGTEPYVEYSEQDLYLQSLDAEEGVYYYEDEEAYMYDQEEYPNTYVDEYDNVYYDQEYNDYWQEEYVNQDSIDKQQEQQQTVDSLPVQTQGTFIQNFNAGLTSFTLLNLGMWVLAIGVLVYIVNHIHDTNNSHFMPEVAKKSKATTKKSKKVKQSNAKK